MNVLESLLSAGGGGIVKQLAGQFGITADQTTSVISALLPALAGGLKEKLASGQASGVSDLITGGTLSKFADDPASLGTPAALQQGQSLLSNIFGSGDVSNLVAKVGEKSGVSSGVISSLLPIAATLLGGYLSKNAASGQGNVMDTLGDISNIGEEGILGAVKSIAAKLFG
jgi:hypothetical protein